MTLRKLFLVLVMCCPLSQAQGASNNSPAPPSPAPLSLLAPLPLAGNTSQVAVDPRSPQKFLEDFENLIHKSDLSAAARYLRFKPGVFPNAEAREDAALKLYEVLDRTIGIRPKSLSSDEGGRKDDGLPDNVDLVGTLIKDGEKVPIEIIRANGVPPPYWQFSPTFTSQIPRLHEIYCSDRIARYLPEFFSRIEFLDIALWQWLGLVATLVLGVIGAWAVSFGVRLVFLRLARRASLSYADEIVEEMKSPLRMILGLLIALAGITALRFNADARGVFYFIGRTALVIAFTWVMFRTVNVVANVAGRNFLASGRVAAYSTIPLGRKTAKATLGILGIIGLLQNFGVNVSALIAGLGVGGLAVALAGQKTLENFFGGLTVSVDQPVRVGDLCKFGNQQGTVEDVGLRSVKIRTAERTVVTVPNADFSQMQLENFTKRDKIRFYTILPLRYETTPNQMRAVLIALRKLLAAHEKVDQSSVSVRFITLNVNSLDIEVSTYVTTADAGEFAAIREDLLLHIMDIVTHCGTAFARPSSTTYLARDQVMDAEKQHQIEQQVQLQISKNELWMPDIPESEREKLRGTVPFPPKGSATPRATDQELRDG